MDIEGLGEQRVVQLVGTGLIGDPADLYALGRVPSPASTRWASCPSTTCSPPSPSPRSGPQPAARRPRHPPRGPDRRACPRPGVRQPRALRAVGPKPWPPPPAWGPVIAASVADSSTTRPMRRSSSASPSRASRSSSPGAARGARREAAEAAGPLAGRSVVVTGTWRATAARGRAAIVARAARPRARSRSDVRGRRRRRPGGGEVTKARSSACPCSPRGLEPLLATGELGAAPHPIPPGSPRCPSARASVHRNAGSLCSLGQPQCRKSPNSVGRVWKALIDCSPPGHRRIGARLLG